MRARANREPSGFSLLAGAFGDFRHHPRVHTVLRFDNPVSSIEGEGHGDDSIYCGAVRVIEDGCLAGGLDDRVRKQAREGLQGEAAPAGAGQGEAPARPVVARLHLHEDGRVDSGHRGLRGFSLV